MGAFGYVFSDFGKAFTVRDLNGEAPTSRIITDVSTPKEAFFVGGGQDMVHAFIACRSSQTVSLQVFTRPDEHASRTHVFVACSSSTFVCLLLTMDVLCRQNYCCCSFAEPWRHFARGSVCWLQFAEVLSAPVRS